MDAPLILAIDIGTTSLKMGVFMVSGNNLVPQATFSKNYQINTYQAGLFSDIDQSQWKSAFFDGCRHLARYIPHIDIISLSGTTPGLSAMDSKGEALYPAILMLDQRSRTEAQEIIKIIGTQALLELTGNIPVAGGCSLAGILWLRKNHPDIYRRSACFGHANTYFAKWLTGEFAIDPSSASLSALYNTSSNNMTWNTEISAVFEIDQSKLPGLIYAYESPGTVKPEICRQIGFVKFPTVLIGGNDAVLAAYAAGINSEGDIMNVNGTCEISLVCLSKCFASTAYNIRTHVLPGRWLTLYVMNAGGKALEWFKSLFCSEMSDEEFFYQFIPNALNEWLEKQSAVRYVPYLMGSRYSQKPLKAEFKALTPTTTREELVASVIRGLCEYQHHHILEMSKLLRLSDTVCITGGAINDAIIRAKNRWMWPAHYYHVKESSLLGAAMLGEYFITRVNQTKV